MKIVMFSMTPLFRNRSMGGAQKQLRKVALHLAQEGHEVTILCTRRDDASEPFRWHERLEVRPIYRFKQPYPEPYDTQVYHIAAAIQDTAEYLAQADVFYNHDGGLIFPYIYQDIPAVFSLRSILFAETLQSGFLFQGDALILPSQHTADSWMATAGRFFPGLRERIRVIPNGLDWDEYQPQANPAALPGLPVNPSQHALVLYPHRPDDAKGIRQTIAVVDALVHRHGLDQVRCLVPQWIDTGVSAAVSDYYRGLQDEIAQRGLTGHFVFHPWISDDQMAAYYRMGAVTLVLGSYVETFGNTPYESLACGTPVIVARVGPYRDMLPEDLVDLVDYGDVDEAAVRAAAIIREQRRTPARTMEWLHAYFDQGTMVRTYAEVILGAQKRGPIAYQAQPITPQTAFRLAPWCAVTAHGIYHDFLGCYLDDAALVQTLAQRDAAGLIAADPAHFDLLMRWYREGILMPAHS